VSKREAVASAIAIALGYNPNEVDPQTWHIRRDDFRRAADAAIAALGLDDEDKAAMRNVLVKYHPHGDATLDIRDVYVANCTFDVDDSLPVGAWVVRPRVEEAA
jgi:hypothetical protein